MDEMQDNKSLRNYYEKVYEKGKDNVFLKYRHREKVSHAHILANEWLVTHFPTMRSILDFGCGEADFLASFEAVAQKIGIDFSEKALANAREKYTNINLILGSSENLSTIESMDVVSSFGTLEHLDSPQKTFTSLAQCLKKDGILVVSCPNFLNVRGVIWMTLVRLFDVPMSLSDKHFLSPADFKGYEQGAGVELVHYCSVDMEISQGRDFPQDMKKRLTNALGDAKMDNSKVGSLLLWVEDNLPYFAANELSGAEVLYFFRKK